VRLPGPRKAITGSARRSPDKPLMDAGSIPAGSTFVFPMLRRRSGHVYRPRWRIQPESTHRGFRLVLFLGVASKAQVRDAVDVIVAAEMLGRTGLKCAGRGECPAMPFKGRDELLPATSFASLNGCGKNELGMPFTRGTISARPQSTVIRKSGLNCSGTLRVDC